MRIFISTEDAEDALSRAFLERASREGWALAQSPRSADDPRWPNWYAAGCAEAVDAADVVVSIVTPGWSSSTWMAHEAETALRGRRLLFLWNPAGRPVPLGMVGYARHPLPADLEAAVAVLGQVAARLAEAGESLPAADPGREQQAEEIFPLAMSPEEYAARHARQWLCFSFDDYRYADPALDRWIHRLGDILFHRHAAPSLAELRARYLSAEEREQAERHQEEL
jgi:hypothetical protein